MNSNLCGKMVNEYHGNQYQADCFFCANFSRRLFFPHQFLIAPMDDIGYDQILLLFLMKNLEITIIRHNHRYCLYVFT